MLYCVHETFWAAVVLSVGLLRLVSRAWVVVLLKAVPPPSLNLKAGLPLVAEEVEVVLVVGDGPLDVGELVVTSAGAGITGASEERKTFKTSVNLKLELWVIHSDVATKAHDPEHSHVSSGSVMFDVKKSEDFLDFLVFFSRLLQKLESLFLNPDPPSRGSIT